MGSGDGGGEAAGEQSRDPITASSQDQGTRRIDFGFEFELFADLIKVDVDAAFFDLKGSGMARLKQSPNLADVERQRIEDFKRRNSRIDVRHIAREVTAGVQRNQIEFARDDVR